MPPDLVIKNWVLNKDLICIALFIYNIQVTKTKLKLLKPCTSNCSPFLQRL